MDVFLVAKQVLVLFLLMGVGAVCRRTRLLTEAAVRGIVNVLVVIVTPALIVDCFRRPYDTSMMKGLFVAFAAAVSVHLLAMALAKLLVRHPQEDGKRVLLLSAVFSNAGFMGIPLEQALLGEKGVFYGSVYVAVFNLFIWSWGLSTMQKSASRRFSWRALVNPGTIGLVCGLVVFVGGMRVAEPIRVPISMLADLNTPLAMIVIGFYLAGAKLKTVLASPAAYIASALRLVVLPLMVTGVLFPFRAMLDSTLLLAMVVPVAAPVAAMVTMFAAQHGRDVDMSVGMVSGTTLLSAMTMPLVIAFASAVLR